MILDDDIFRIGYWVGYNNRVFLEGVDLMSFIENGFRMCNDLGVKFWGLNLIWDKRAYREFQPFKLVAYIGGPWQGHCGKEYRYDEEMVLKDDLDMILQVLNKERRVLRFQMAHYECDQGGSGGVLKGGVSYYRTVEKEKEQNKKLADKWGSKIVGSDSGKSIANKKKETVYDINPILRIPIKGV